VAKPNPNNIEITIFPNGVYKIRLIFIYILNR
jgi:hypothetical protein